MLGTQALIAIAALAAAAYPVDPAMGDLVIRRLPDILRGHAVAVAEAGATGPFQQVRAAAYPRRCHLTLTLFAGNEPTARRTLDVPLREVTGVRHTDRLVTVAIGDAGREVVIRHALGGPPNAAPNTAGHILTAARHCGARVAAADL